jgi:hypothetical protein
MFKSMKKLILICSIFLLPMLIQAQRTVEITPFGGYVFASRMSGADGYVRFIDNAQYGGMISFGVSRSMDVDLIYNRSDTKAQVNLSSYPYSVNPISINYMNIGFTKNFRINPTVSPFFGFSMGACLIAPKSNNIYDYWFFDFGLSGGAKVYFGKHFGLRLQAQMYVPMQAAGYTIYFGTSGAGSGISVYSTMVQFGFTGGLIFRLGHVADANSTRITY